MDIEQVLRRIKLSDLRLLNAVVQQGGMAKAAAHLNISQPAVSKAIAALEDNLGVRLLDRAPTGVELTMYGRALLKGGVAVFDELKQSVKQIEFLANPTTGDLRIGSSEPLVIGLVSAVIDRLSRRYPQIVFHVTQTESPRLQRALRERNIELALGRMDPFLEEDMQAEELFNETLYVVAGRRSAWTRKRRIELAELIDEPWTLPPYSTIPGALIADIFRASGLKVPQANVVAFNIPLHCGLLATGRFLTVLPGSVLRLYAERSSFKILPVKLPQKPSPFWMITLKNRTLNPIVKIFMDCAREVAKPLARAT